MKLKLTKGEKAYMQMPVEVKTIDKEVGTLEAIFSTQDVDRHGDVVLQDGWDLSNFKRNPVILNSHNYGDAAEVIGKASNVKVESKKLTGKITFAVNENPKAKVIFDLYAGGFLNAFSVGFIPSQFKENKDGSIDWYTIEEAELLEVSAVSVPANARALAKAKGIDIELLTKKENDHENDNQGTEGDDALPKGDEVPPTDGEPTPKDGDGSESGSEAGDESAGDDAGGEAGDETVPPQDPESGDGEDETDGDDEGDDDTGDEAEPVDPPKQPQKSYSQRVVKAIEHVNESEKQELRRVSKIIRSILDGDAEGKLHDERIKSQVRKRKINQAIRGLMKIK